MPNYYILIIILFGNIISIALGLRCYTCGFTDMDNKDKACVSNPDLVEGKKITKCNKKYCTITRQEFKKPAGKVNTLYRGCEDKPQVLNDVIEDTTYKWYFRSCTNDLCNSGDGRSSNIEKDIDIGAGDNQIVPGRSESNKNFICLRFMFILTGFLIRNNFN